MSIEAKKRYYEKNKEKVKAAAVVWKKNNPDKVRSGSKIYRDATKERAKELQNAWVKNNRDKVNAKAKRYYEAHSELCRDRSRRYYAVDPAKAKAIRDKYRATPEYRAIGNNNACKRRLRLATGKLSKGLVEQLLKLQRGKCACCGKSLGADYHLDHIMPLVRGGLNIDSNIQLLRAECNNNKHAKHPVDFMQERGYLL